MTIRTIMCTSRATSIWLSLYDKVGPIDWCEMALSYSALGIWVGMCVLFLYGMSV